MRILTTLTLLALLASCGADGAPKPPAAEPGISLTGQVQVGVSGS
jgi:hypothetical protein